MTAGLTGTALVYLAVAVAAAAEGEVGYVAASALVLEGKLEPLGVMVAGAIGATLGDQAYFYVLRSRLTRHLREWPALRRRAEPLLARVRANDALMVMLIRFAPGFRIALAAACAYAGVAPAKFSLLNAATAVVWAVLIMGLVAWAGPASVAAFGLSGWLGALLMGIVIVLLVRLGKRHLTAVFREQPPT